MKKILLFAITVITAALSFSCNEGPIDTPAPATDDTLLRASLPLPDRKMKDVSGKMISLNDAKMENGLLVMFSCNTCPFVEKNQKRTLEISNYALQKKVGVILVNSNEDYRDNDDSYDAMKDYASDQGYQWPYVVDENSVLADTLGAMRTPEIFLFASDGRLVYRGAIDNNPGDESKVTRKHLQIAVDELVTGKEIAIKSTRSVGCGIKRKG